MSGIKHGTLEKGYEKWNGVSRRFFYNKQPKERILLLAELLIHFLLAAAFSGKALPYTEMSVGVPLADALLCSAGKGIFGVYAGAVYGAFLTKTVSFSRCFSLTLVIALRLTVSFWIRGKERGFLRESVLIKVGYSAVMALIQSAFYLTEVGVSDGVWRRLLATCLALPVLSAVFSVFFAGCPKKSVGRGGHVERALYEISMTAFFAAVSYSLTDIRYFGVSVSTLAALVLTLFTASRGGMLRGGVNGFVLGLACKPSLAISFATVGGAAGAFYCLGVLPAAGISVFAGACVSLLQAGYTAFYVFIPEAVFSVAVASPIIRYSFLPERFPYPKNEAPREYGDVGAAEARALYNLKRNRELVRLSETLMDISDGLGRENTDGVKEKNLQKSKEICVRLSAEFCDSCALSLICWESEAKKTEVSVTELVSAVSDGREPLGERGADHLSGYCIRFRELSEEIKRLCGSTEEKSEACRESGALGLRAVAEMLSDMANRARLEEARDTDAEAAVKLAAGSIGFKPEALSVSGTERKLIYAYGVKEKISNEENEIIRKAFSEACKTEYASPVLSDADGSCMIFSPKKTLSARSYCLKSTKNGEICSGDSVFTTEAEDGYFYAALADGMGSGEEARRASESALSMLERLLKCKIKKSAATELVGDVLKRRGGECFTTVDIMELDLVSGKASFLKSGAAASYIVRNGGVYRINAVSMPVGITEEAHPEEIGFKLLAGDTVIMLSDGIASDGTDGKWISETVCGGFESIEALAELIMKKSGELNVGDDDKTVLITSVEVAKSETRAMEA